MAALMGVPRKNHNSQRQHHEALTDDRTQAERHLDAEIGALRIEIVNHLDLDDNAQFLADMDAAPNRETRLAVCQSWLDYIETLNDTIWPDARPLDDMLDDWTGHNQEPESDTDAERADLWAYLERVEAAIANYEAGASAAQIQGEIKCGWKMN